MLNDLFDSGLDEALWRYGADGLRFYSGAWLRHMRETIGAKRASGRVSQRELAEAIGVSRPSIARWESENGCVPHPVALAVKYWLASIPN